MLTLSFSVFLLVFEYLGSVLLILFILLKLFKFISKFWTNLLYDLFKVELLYEIESSSSFIFFDEIKSLSELSPPFFLLLIFSFNECLEE